jgi:hypothetical protein
MTTTTPGTCLGYFYIGSDVLKNFGPCKVRAGQYVSEQVATATTSNMLPLCKKKQFHK